MGPSTRTTVGWDHFANTALHIERSPDADALDAGKGRNVSAMRRRHADANKRTARDVQGSGDSNINQRIAAAEAAGRDGLADRLRALK